MKNYTKAPSIKSTSQLSCEPRVNTKKYVVGEDGKLYYSR